MIYALLKALFFKPRLLAEHVGNYVELIRGEMGGTVRQWLVKVVAWAVFGIGMLVFLVLSGVAAMIGIILGQYHWILLLVPAVPLVCAVIALVIGLRKAETSGISHIKSQFSADMQALSRPAAKNHEH